MTTTSLGSPPRQRKGQGRDSPLSTSPLAGRGITLAFLFGFAASVSAQVSLGIDELRKSNFEPLQGRRVALITNHTGVDRDGDSTVDILLKAPYVKLVCILTPEHGFRGTAEHGQSVADQTDPVSGLPVYSLYGVHSKPTDAMLTNVDTIVFDIQDIGTRFYTYITTMGMALEVAAKKNMKFVVLDRPNPIRGDIIEGDILDADIRRMTGYFSIPTRHGLTIGELAGWYNQTAELNADVVVVPLKRWSRGVWFDQTGLEFTPPSPNMRSVNAALLYPGVGCFEATNVSVGRGTDTPFEIFGAPWIKGKELAAFLREKNFPGLLVEPVAFTPADDLYANQKCEGIRIILTNRALVRPFDVFVHSFLYLMRTYPKDFLPEWEEVRVVTGSNKLKETAEGRRTVDEYLALIDEKLREFREQISPFFLY